MRWPIGRQLLIPFLFVVILALVVASAMNAWSNAQWARQRQAEDFERLVQTLELVSARFPLTENVLAQMRGLTGAHFAVFDRWGSLQQATLELEPAAIETLKALQKSPATDGFAPQQPVTINGQPFLAQKVAVLSQASGSRTPALIVLYPEAAWRQASLEAIYPPLQVGAGAAVVVVLLSMLLARRFARRIERLQEHASHIAAGDFRPLQPWQRNDELRDLALSLNQMAEQLRRYEEQIRKNERLRTLGQLGGGIAHQLRNSATGALMALELHERTCSSAEDESLQVAARQLKLMQTYLQRFLTLGRTEPRPQELVVLNELVEEVLDLVQPMCKHTSVDLRFQRPPQPLTIPGDADALRQLVVNLVMNAVEAANQPGANEPYVEIELEGTDKEAVLRVCDNGPGPDESVREQLFEPFTTEKPDGTGLGLSVCRQVARQHGGEIDWQRQDRRTCFNVRLQRDPSEPSEQTPNES